MAERQDAYGSPSDDELDGWSESDIEALRSSLPPAEDAAAADLKSISDRSRDDSLTLSDWSRQDSLEELIRRDQLYAQRQECEPEFSQVAGDEYRQSSSSVMSTVGNSTDLGSSFDGASVSPSLLREHRDAFAFPAGVPNTISEGAQHLQEQPSHSESRRSREISSKARSMAAKATRRTSNERKNSSQVPSNLGTQPESQGQSTIPSLAEGLGFSQLMSFQRGQPKGRCSCMLKRHFDERSRLSRDLGQEAALTDSDTSFANLMKSASTSSSRLLQRQLSDTDTSQPSSEPWAMQTAHRDHGDAASVSDPPTLSNQNEVSLIGESWVSKSGSCIRTLLCKAAQELQSCDICDVLPLASQTEPGALYESQEFHAKQLDGSVHFWS